MDARSERILTSIIKQIDRGRKMSLSDAMLDLADRIEKDIQTYFASDRASEFLLRGYANEIRSAVKSAGRENNYRVSDPILDDMKERNKVSTIRREPYLPEGNSPVMVELVGGPFGDIPEFVELPGMPPPGSKPIIAGAVYLSKGDGKLYFQEEDTKAYRNTVRLTGAVQAG